MARSALPLILVDNANILSLLGEGEFKFNPLSFEEAKMIIDRYPNRLMDGGFSHFIDPIHGDGTWFWGTWNRAVFTILARLVSEG